MSQKPASFRWLTSTRIPSSPQRRTSARPASVSPGPVSGDDGEMNGTPWANAFGRLHTGPIDRSPAPYQRSSASSPGSIASAPSRWSTAAGGPASSPNARSRSAPHRAIRTCPRPLERQQPPGDRARVGGRHRVLHRWSGLELEHPIVPRDLHLPRAPIRAGEHREDPSAHAAGAHPREVEVAAGPAVRDQSVIVGGEGIVVPVEYRRHGGYSVTGSGQVDRRQPVDAVGVLLALVVEQRLGAADADLLRGPQLRVRPIPLVLHQRDAVPAGIGDAQDLHEYDRTPGLGGGRLGEPAQLHQLTETLIGGRNHFAPAVQPQDPGRPLERAEHDHDPPVLADVGDRLGAAPDHVEIGHARRREHAQRVDRPLGRDVHVPVRVERSGAHEEHRLPP